MISSLLAVVFSVRAFTGHSLRGGNMNPAIPVNLIRGIYRSFANAVSSRFTSILVLVVFLALCLPVSDGLGDEPMTVPGDQSSASFRIFWIPLPTKRAGGCNMFSAHGPNAWKGWKKTKSTSWWMWPFQRKEISARIFPMRPYS
jgi:hypothetical protein